MTRYGRLFSPASSTRTTLGCSTERPIFSSRSNRANDTTSISYCRYGTFNATVAPDRVSIALKIVAIPPRETTSVRRYPSRRSPTDGSVIHVAHSRDRANQRRSRKQRASGRSHRVRPDFTASPVCNVHRTPPIVACNLQSDGTHEGSVLLCGRAESFPERQVDLENIRDLLAEKAVHRRPRFILKDALDVRPETS